MVVFPLVIIFVLLVFCGWDWLNVDNDLNTGTLQGVQYIGSHPEMWGDVAKGIVILLLVVLVWIGVSILVLPVLFNGKGMNE